ncbi:DUF4198 domain-containing protein [Pseudoroseicyclus tamaricis]|uniref:DUF4198 domain-containing protein n=1 Tax=Pseudoroseicyclus tamaricis TaxID=2705421 RepID=A0A6B2JNK8_9RHOB|nr:DUF4198 domain-containing protein [Pseudoroseicyclus tamaricis]NDV00277.1 DUF4198 domain-containing protein [Pseudoroseicyclus tamaricis]
MAGALILSMLALPAQAHFLSIYTPETNLSAPTTAPVELIFWHPLSGGHVMDMGGMPEEFFMVHRGERVDLMDRLEEIAFESAGASGQAYTADVEFRSSGDYILTAIPAPYLEETEDIYIQQLTKAYVNRGQLPTDWAEPVGLPTEILPLSRPYNQVVGGTFTGQVLREGEPAGGVEIEVEYIAATPDPATHSAGDAVIGEPPGGTIALIADENGYFTFGIPRAGWWGFAALGSGPVTEHEGKELSQDAVIWITAVDWQ